MIFLSGMAVGFVLCFVCLYTMAVLRRLASLGVRGTHEKVRMGEQVVAVVSHDDGRKTIIEGGTK